MQSRKSILIDANIILRYLLCDSKDLYYKAEKFFKEVEKGSYLILGELQYFLTSGSRDKLEKEIISEMENYGFYLKKVFVKDPEVFNIKFDTNIIIHDMLYTHPKIFLFQKYE